MPDRVNDDILRDILTKTRTIALVGASANPQRASHEVMQFLQAQGYRILPVNPILAGSDLLGERVYASLESLPEIPDMIDIFRNSAAAGEVVEEALALPHRPKVIWMQLEVINQAAAARAESAGMTVVMDRCPKIEYQRLMPK